MKPLTRLERIHKAISLNGPIMTPYKVHDFMKKKWPRSCPTIHEISETMSQHPLLKKTRRLHYYEGDPGIGGHQYHCWEYQLEEKK